MGKKASGVERLDTPVLVGSIKETIRSHTVVSKSFIDELKGSFGKASKKCKHHGLLIPKIKKYGCRITKGTCNKDDCPRIKGDDGYESNKHNRSNKRRRW